MSFSSMNYGRVSMQTQCGSLEVSSQSWNQDIKLTDGYLSVFNEGLNHLETGQFLFGFDDIDLKNRDARVTVICNRNGETTGGLHWHISEENEMWIRGAVVRQEHRGNQLGAAMVATSLVHSYMNSYTLPAPTCVIRILSDNTDNVASRKTFERIGFSSDVNIAQTYLNFDWKDQHLRHSAEIDDNGRYYFRYRKMVANASVFDTARSFLRFWSHKVAA
jgi:hypothetical protein